jgi:uncharacterized damage-inducible protein DinB
MSDFRAAVKSGMIEYFTELKTKVDGLTEVEVRWQPTLETNTIQWLVWHMADVEDSWINEAIGGNQSVWARSGWTERTGINIEDHFGYKGIEAVRSFPPVEMSSLLEYYDEVRDAAFKVIDGISNEDLSNTDTRRGGKATWEWILGHVLVEESQHLGQIALIRGMVRGLNA